MTDRYQDTWNHGEVSDVVAAFLRHGSMQPQQVMKVLNLPSSPPKPAEEAIEEAENWPEEFSSSRDVALSTVSTKLRALERDGLMKKDGWEYTLNVDAIYDEMTSFITAKISDNRIPLDKFHEHKDTIFGNEDIREHLLGYLETELQFGKLSQSEKEYNNMRESISINDAIRRYHDDDIFRLRIMFKLGEASLDDIPEEKQPFWKYLTIIHGGMSMAARSENIHDDALQEQISPSEEIWLPTLTTYWNTLQERGREYLEEL